MKNKNKKRNLQIQKKKRATKVIRLKAGYVNGSVLAFLSSTIAPECNKTLPCCFCHALLDSTKQNYHRHWNQRDLLQYQNQFLNRNQCTHQPHSQ